MCSLCPILSPATAFLTTPLHPACFPLTLGGLSLPISSAAQLRLAQDHYTCASPYDTGVGRGDEVEGGVVLLIFYTFVRL